MAATLMQPIHRPSMDQFDQRSPSAPFSASSSFDRAPSPAGPPRPRTSSNSTPTPSAPSAPFPQQPYANSYYHQRPPTTAFHPPAGAWPAPAAPPPSFYPPQFQFPHGPNGAIPQGFQQHNPDFSAWAHVYQQMVAGGHMPAVPQQQQQQQQQYDADPSRRRTASGPAPPGPPPGQSQSHEVPRPPGAAAPIKGVVPQPQAFHPYKRGPQQQPHRTMPRSTSQPAAALDEIVQTARAASASPDEHRRTGSDPSRSDPARPGAFAPPPKIRTDGERRNSASSGSSRSGAASPAQASPRLVASPVSMSSTHNRSRSESPVNKSTPAAKSTPLTPGAIAANATNAQTRPSPLAQSAALPPEQASPEKKTGFKNRFKSALSADKDTTAKLPAKPQPPPPAPSRTEGSAAARTLPNGAAPTTTPLAPPHSPFTASSVPRRLDGDDVSLAETERTAATTATKSKRSLFRIRNKSSDNVSLSSTVSSASMMIRKMGNLGKMARRNSLMGISKIFKGKEQEEEPVPEKQKDGILSFKKKGGRKAEVAPATVSHTHAELDRVSEDDDRVLSGLSPAAALARQHTVRSKAEAAKREAEAKRRATAAAPVPEFGPSEPTWDRSTTTRNTQAAAASEAAASGTNVVHVVPRSPHVIHHAVAISQAEYDSDDSSDGDTIEDVTTSMKNSTITEELDQEFEALWGKANINRNARPKKGILKNCVSNEDLEKLASKQRTPSPEVVSPSHGPLSELPAPIPERIDGNAHAVQHSPRDESAYDPLSPDFSPFDSTPIELDFKPATMYKHPVHNTSAPQLSLAGEQVVNPQARSMTVPARRRLVWAPECAVYSTYDSSTYDRRSEPATCNRLTPELAMAIKQELNAFKLEMPVHPSSRVYTHYFA